MGSASILAVSFIILDCITAPMAYFKGILTIFYIPPLFVGIVIFLSTLIILKDQSIENSAKVSKRIKLGMLVILLAFAAGSPFLASLF
jgi:geranylgeranylglycerol-phosphate geranylgeranyltransferase